jgi:uncharacterized protein (DUF433 family)
MGLDRITRNPEVMGGKPCLRGMRVTVGTIVGLVASGRPNAEILAAYPYLEEEDIRQALACGLACRGDRSSCSCRMKFLIDMNLSPLWVRFLAEKGFDSVHWSSIGRSSAPDTEIMDHAAADQMNARCARGPKRRREPDTV